MKRLFFSVFIAVLGAMTLTSCGEEKDQQIAAPQGDELFKTRSASGAASSMEAYRDLIEDIQTEPALDLDAE